MVINQRKSLGEGLVEQKIISDDQLQYAQKESGRTGESLTKTLIKLKLAKEDAISTFFEEQLGIPKVDLKSYLIDPKIIALIPESLAKKHTIIPLFKTGDTLTIATADPLNIFAIDEVRIKTKSNVEPAVATETEIKDAINQYYKVGGSIEDVIKSMDVQSFMIEEGRGEKEEIDDTEKLRNIAEEAPIIKLVNLIIMQAVRDKASDIHVEPEDDRLVVRYRVDGILHEQVAIPKLMQAAVLSRIKIMSDMNIATKRVPQDGRFKLNIEGNRIDMRVSALPTIYGENIVMRILETSSILMGLEKLGFNENNLKNFRSLIVKPHGIILVTGPTGSGKTTTLYSALNVIDTPDKNIITVEDPVEYQLRRVRQSQINIKAGLTFATGLRSILRQDPDVIMVGEIRDLETAEISVQAALTGHLVFSTLHTNDAPSSLTRLVDMGVEPFLISSSVIAIIAQRLVRKICKECKQSYVPSKEILDRLGAQVSRNAKFYRGEGCKVCKNTGYKGRLGIFEMLLLNDKIKDMVLTKVSSTQIKAAAQEAGMQTLREDGIEKVLDGSTTIDEVIRVTQD